MTEKETLMRRLSSAQFAAWESHMFLDTHPQDAKVMEMMREYDKKAEELMKEYENKYGPLKPEADQGDTRFRWLKDPWPWDYDQEGGND